MSPNRIGRAVVADDIDAVVAHRVLDGVRNRLLFVHTVQACGDAVVEREAVPGEPATWKQRHGNPLEGAAPVRPGW